MWAAYGAMNAGELLPLRRVVRLRKRERADEPSPPADLRGNVKGLKRKHESAFLCGFAERATGVGPGPYVFNPVARRSCGGPMSLSPPQAPAPVLPQAPGAPPVFGAQGTGPGQKPQAKASQPTFLGSGLVASQQNQGQKSLIGGAGLGS